jgi:hypothetical protein
MEVCTTPTTMLPLEPYMAEGICYDYLHKKISTMKFREYESIFNMYTQQTKLKDIFPQYSLYKIDVMTKEFSHHIDIECDIGNMYHTTLQSNSQFIMLHTLCPESIITYISEQKSVRYVFFPVMLAFEEKEVGHCTQLCFDKIMQKVYLIDPNGSTTFFNSMFLDMYKKQSGEMFYDEFYQLIIDGAPLVDMLFEGYVKILNDSFGLNYVFEPQTIWNNQCMVLNKSFTDSVIGSGHCVILSVMVAHFLHLTCCDVNVAFEEFAKLKNKELIYIINSYSLGFIQFT